MKKESRSQVVDEHKVCTSKVLRKLAFVMLDATVSEQLHDDGYPDLISMSIKRPPGQKRPKFRPTRPKFCPLR